MKNRHWLPLVLLAGFLALFLGYRAWDALGADNTAPEILIQDTLLLVSTQDPEEMLLQGVTATDGADGDVTDSLLVERITMTGGDGTASVTYAAFDRAGNVAKASRIIRYTDYQGPRFSLSAPLLYFQSSFDLLSAIHASDPMDGDISNWVRVTVLGEDSLTLAGIHQVLLQVTNSLGHTVELTVPVEVRTASASQGQLALTEYLVYVDRGSDFQPTDYLDSFQLGTSIVELGGTVPQGFLLQTTGVVDTETPGVYTVTYELTQTQNGRDYTAVSKLIVVVEDRNHG